MAGDPVERRVVGKQCAVAKGEALDPGQSFQHQGEIGAQQLAPTGIRRSDLFQRHMLKILQIEPQMIGAFSKRAFHTFEQFMPLLLQHEAFEMLT